MGAARRLSVDISPGVVGREDALGLLELGFVLGLGAVGLTLTLTLTAVKDGFGIEFGFVVPVAVFMELEAPISSGIGFMFKSRLVVLELGMDACSLCCIIGLELDTKPCTAYALTGLLPILNCRDWMERWNE